MANAAVAANPAMVEIQDVPGLPRVLLIGDSISIGYTLPVRGLLQGTRKRPDFHVWAGAT